MLLFGKKTIIKTKFKKNKYLEFKFYGLSNNYCINKI